MTTATFLAQVSHQIELGYPDEAITRLIVMLDLAAEHSASLADARNQLREHPLFAMLAQEPALMIAHSCAPDRINQLISQICAPQTAAVPPATAAALSQIIAASSFNRAIRARVKHAGEMLARAWQGGRSIAILGDSFDCELAVLRGRDLSNLSTTATNLDRFEQLSAMLGPSAAIVPRTATEFMVAAAAEGTKFDLIYFPRAAEAMSAAQLGNLLERAWQVLAPAGSIVVPAFMADRIARGWQQACLDWHVQDHTEAGLLAADHARILQSRVLGDQAGCFGWLIASHKNAQIVNRGTRS